MPILPSCRIRKNLIESGTAIPIRRNGRRQHFIRGKARREYMWIGNGDFRILYRGRYWDASSIDFEFLGGE